MYDGTTAVFGGPTADMGSATVPTLRILGLPSLRMARSSAIVSGDDASVVAAPGET